PGGRKRPISDPRHPFSGYVIDVTLKPPLDTVQTIIIDFVPIIRDGDLVFDRPRTLLMFI
ncbi:MAG: hypothetical protein OES26_25095, partial [Gammaproteobacteria bacterium]|nr:hypothetical protein [Gammaproteobacteria bacterium]